MGSVKGKMGILRLLRLLRVLRVLKVLRVLRGANVPSNVGVHTNDRSVGQCPLRGKGGAEGTKGGVFPSAEGRLYGFLNTKRAISRCDSNHKRKCIPLCIDKNHTTSLRLRKCTPSAFGISPDGAMSYGPIIVYYDADASV